MSELGRYHDFAANLKFPLCSCIEYMRAFSRADPGQANHTAILVGPANLVLNRRRERGLGLSRHGGSEFNQLCQHSHDLGACDSRQRARRTVWCVVVVGNNQPVDSTNSPPTPRIVLSWGMNRYRKYPSVLIPRTTERSNRFL